MRRPAALRTLAGAAAALLLAGAAPAPTGPRPGPESKCPVCGMFVARYPDWVAGAVLADGSTRWFDGAKDLFKWLLHPERYGPAQAGAAPQRLLVTDYYAVTPVDARQAFYVLGSDVLGPMGTELVPFARREDAEEFLKDHHGRAILRFAEVTDATIRTLQAVE